MEKMICEKADEECRGKKWTCSHANPHENNGALHCEYSFCDVKEDFVECIPVEPHH